MKYLLKILALAALTTGTAYAQDHPPQTPAEVHQQWVASFNAKDIDWLCSLYADDAAVQKQDGTVSKGRVQVCDDLAHLISISKSIDLETYFVVEGDNIAILRSLYTLELVSEDNSLQKVPGSGIEVVQKQADGSWLIVADHPTGAN